MAGYLSQRRWIQAHFSRLSKKEAWYNYDDPQEVNEARFIAEIRDLHRFNCVVGGSAGFVAALFLMRKFTWIEAVPAFLVAGFVGKEVNVYRNHDYMYVSLLRVVTKDPTQPI